jgi:hypothetical protein
VTDSTNVNVGFIPFKILFCHFICFLIFDFKNFIIRRHINP